MENLLEGVLETAKQRISELQCEILLLKTQKYYVEMQLITSLEAYRALSNKKQKNEKNKEVVRQTIL